MTLASLTVPYPKLGSWQVVDTKAKIQGEYIHISGQFIIVNNSMMRNLVDIDTNLAYSYL